MKLVFTTIAFTRPYAQMARKLVHSLAQYAPLVELVIVTDCPHLFQDTCKTTIISHTPDYEAIANMKYLAIKYAVNFHPDASHFVYLDCDCYLIDKFQNKWVTDLPYGLHVSIGDKAISHNQLENQGMREKWQFFNPDTNIKITSFIERGFILITSDADKFSNEWKKLYKIAKDNNFTQAGEFIEISLSAINCCIPIIKIAGNPLQGVIFTEERDNHLHPTFR